MIVKQFELNKFDFTKFNIYLFYGRNEGLQNKIAEKYLIKDFGNDVQKYEEIEVINNKDIIIEEILSKSLFENNKIIIISRATDKIVDFIRDILERNIKDVLILLKSLSLEKRSKLRTFFEKNKSLAVIPFYEDDEKNLSSIIYDFLKQNNIKLSRESINLLVSRAGGDRKNLNMELDKILNYSISNKKIEYSNVEKLTNLVENYTVNELANSYLSKNKKNVTKILNENNYTDEDCVLILRTILSKSKRLLTIMQELKKSENIDKAISDIRPPIFWKEKDSVKRQVISWKAKDLKKKIYEINDIELLIKSNSKNSLNFVSDFILNY